MLKFLSLVIICVGLSAQAHRNFSFDLTWMKVKAKTKEDRTKIHSTGAVIESIQDDYVIVLAKPQEKNQLEKMGIVEVSFPYTTQMLDFPPEDAQFHNYDEVVNAIGELKNKNTNIVQVETIGKSVQGRDIINIKITTNPEKELEKPAIVFMGTHHAREHVSTEIPLLLAQHIVDGYNSGNPQIKKLVETRVIHIIPMVNPDGVEFDISTGSYKMWRKNRANNGNGTFGVDLNRNYGFGWGGEGSSGSPNSDTYRGPKPFSEPETQAIKNFIETRKNITSLLSFHTFSKLVLYPWGHQYDSIQDDAAKRVHETMAVKMASWNGYKPQQASDLYLASGDTTDWAYGEHKIISFTFELDPGSLFEGGFYPGQGIIKSVFNKNIQPCLYMIEYSDNPYRVLEPSFQKLGFNTPLF